MEHTLESSAFWVRAQRFRILSSAVFVGAIGFISGCGAHRIAATGFVTPTSPNVRMHFRTPHMSLTSQGAPTAPWEKQYNTTQIFCGKKTKFLVKVAKRMEVYVQFSRGRHEHHFEMKQWTGEEWTLFCRVFFEHTQRDRATYGWFEDTFRAMRHHGTDDQMYAVLDKAVKNVLQMINDIVEEHGMEGTCGYAGACQGVFTAVEKLEWD